jgi:hypothetical protein
MEPPVQIFLPITPTCVLVCDVETGGFANRNPVISISVLFVDASHEIVYNRFLRVLPPPNTVIEVPCPDSIGLAAGVKPNVQCYYDIYTGEQVHPDCLPADRPYISSYAAELTGLVGIVENPDGTKAWDWSKTQDWMDKALHAEEVDAILEEHVAQLCPDHHPFVLAYNAPFDKRFCANNFPRYSARIGGWKCVMSAYKKSRKARGLSTGKGMNTLASMCEDFGIDPGQAHDALSDTRATLQGFTRLANDGYITIAS